MIRAITLCALLLAGCAASGPNPVRIETVRVAVPIACVGPAEVPAVPVPLPKRPDDARPALDIAIAKLVEFMGPGLDNRGGYAGKSSAILRGCSTVQK